MAQGHPATLIKALQNAKAYPHPVEGVELIETHISWVLLTGHYAYKIKKPLDLGFLDFSTLERRRLCCEEEARLNRRLAPDLYLGVVPITGTVDTPRIGDDGPVLEYAVKMRQFAKEARLDQVLGRGELDKDTVAELSRDIARFHQGAPQTRDARFASPAAVYEPMAQNFAQIRHHLGETKQNIRLARLEAWSDHERQRLLDALQQRQRGGFVRECHGDLHLGNIALIDHHITPFDCIEFNPSLRWIDVISEIAFLSMDVEDRGRPDYAQLCLNAYLEYTGDYEGLRVLAFYKVYRAMVRAKIAAIRVVQPGLGEDEQTDCRRAYDEYLTLAEHFTAPRQRRLMLTYGLSGSGKSTVAEALVMALPSFRVRSDVERKRLFSLSPDARTGATIDAGIYTADADQSTYQRLRQLAYTVIDAGYGIVVDATFLKADQRTAFRHLATELGVPFHILDCRASAPTLRQRITHRENLSGDASEANLAVLEHQIRNREPLSAVEYNYAITVDTTTPGWLDHILQHLDI